MFKTSRATLIDFLSSHAESRSGDRVYTFLGDGEIETATLTYGELDERARAIAARLLQHESPGARVLLLCPAGLDYVAGFFGTLYAGMVAVTAFEYDGTRANRSLPRIRAIAEDAGASIALTTISGAAALVQAASVVPELGDLTVLACDEVPGTGADDWRRPMVDPSTLAILQYTSGSTRQPRGVMLTHGNLLHNAEIERRAWRTEPGSIGVSWLPLYHDLGVLTCLLQPIYVGFSSVLMPPTAFLQRPMRWLEAISRYAGTFAGGPNFAFELCSRKVTDEERARLDLSSWRTAFNGAEPVRPTTIERFVREFGPCGFRAQSMYPCYGLAEANFVSGGLEVARPVVRPFDATALERGEARAPESTSPGESNTRAVRELVGCGRVDPALDVRIVDPQRLTQCADGIIGEIWISGPSVGMGYWRREEETAESFHARLVDGGERRFFRTGDLGFFDERGELFVTGRLKDVIIIRGANHYPHDIELTVERTHPALRSGCGAAFAIPAETGESLVVVQEVSSHSDASATEALIGGIRSAIAEHHGIDVYAIVLIRPGSIFKTTSGKIQRGACRDAFMGGTLDAIVRWDRSPAKASQPVPAEPARQRTRAEIAAWLITAVAARTGISPAAIDPHAPFAAYGLGSLDAVQITGDLQTWIGKRVSPTSIYAFPTIDGLVHHLAGDDSDASKIPPRLDSNEEPIAIVGIGCRFPGASDPRAFWKLLCEGREAVREVPPDRWDARAYFDPDPRRPGKISSTRAGLLDDVDCFDAGFFGISPREAERIDPQHRLLLEVSSEAIEDAGIPVDRLAGSPVGVFVGVTTADYAHLHAGNPESIDVYSTTGTLTTFAANRISYAFDLRGPSLAIDTACSSSLVAVHHACESLRRGESSVALAGGVNLILSPENTVRQTKIGALAPDGRCKPFDAGANGYVRAEGVGIVILKPLSAARADGDRIYAVIRASAINQDGRSNGLTAPNPQAQEALLRDAYGRAGIDPRRVRYVEAHGSGTPLGDRIEAGALGAVVGAGRPPDSPCAIGSVKSNIGHAESAAGIAGLIKTALVLRHRLIPPSLNCPVPNPEIPFTELGLRVQRELEPLTDANAIVAAVSGFGIGGTNAHVVLEEITPREARSAAVASSLLVPLSARDPESLREVAGRLSHMLSSVESMAGTSTLGDIAWTTSTRRAHHPHRATVAARSIEELRERLDRFARGEVAPGVAAGTTRRAGPRRLAFVFSGYGGQWAGMGQRLAREQRFFAESLSLVDTAIVSAGGPSVSALIREQGPEWTNDLELAQPVLFAWQVALTALLRSWGVDATAVVGHSVGELAAAHAAGALSIEDAARVVIARSRILRRTAGSGAMLVVGADERTTRAALMSEPAVGIAVCNGPTNTVISGDREAVARIAHALERRGVFVRSVNIDGAAHGPHVEPFVPELVTAASGIAPRAHERPIYSTVSAEPIDGVALGAAYWGRNLREPVRFSATVRRMLDDGIDAFLEIGPHPVLIQPLTSLFGDADAVAFPSGRRDADEVETALLAVGGLHSAGVSVNWHRLAGDSGRVIDLPTYPFRRDRHWFVPTAARESRQHPLLGIRASNPEHPGAHVWERAVSLDVLEFVTDHALHGAPLVPGLFFVQLVLAAAEEIGYGSRALSDVTFRRALFLRKGENRTLQISITPETDGASFSIRSRSVQQEDDAWVQHASGRIAEPIDEPVSVVDMNAARGLERVDGAQLYDRLRKAGNDFGPRFRGVVCSYRAEDQAFAEVHVPPALADETHSYPFHPALLDACAHVLFAVAPTLTHAVAPISVKRVRLIGSTPSGPLFARATAHKLTAHSIVGDVIVVDGAGEVVAILEGAHLRRVDAAAEGIRYALTWQPLSASGGAVASTRRVGTWLVLADRSGMADAVAEQLRARGDACLVERCDVAGAVEGAVQRALAAGPTLQGILDLGNLDADAANSVDALRRVHQRGSGALVRILRQLATRPHAPRVWTVTRGAVVVLPDERPSLEQAPLWGFARTVALEHPELWGGLIDLDPQDEREVSAQLLVEEIARESEEDQVAFRHGARHCARLVRDRESAPGTNRAALRLRRDASYLITGGLGGIGLQVARWLVEKGARRLILLGRTPLPPRSRWSELSPESRQGQAAAVIRELERLGAHVHLAAVDVSDEAALNEFLESHAREGWPAIRGVVHAASADSLSAITDLTDSDLQTHFAPKALGARNLDQAFAPEALDFFVLFSSAAAILPYPRLAAYAAANAYADALAFHRRARGGHALAIDWGMWSSVGMAARLQRERGVQRAWSVGELDPENAFAALEELVVLERAHAIVQDVSWDEYTRAYPQAARLPVLTELTGASAASVLHVEDAWAPDSSIDDHDVESTIAAEVARTLRLPSARLPTDTPLDALGLDSLVAAELRARLTARLGVPIPLPWLLQRPTLAELADRVRPLVDAATASTTEAAPTLPTEIIESVDGTSIACWTSGAGPTIVLVHGGFDDHSQWDGVLPDLVRAFRVVAIDRRGCGASGPWRTDHRIDREVEDVLSVVAKAGDCILVGHSIGALHALEAAARGARLRGLVLYEPPIDVGLPADLDQLDERWRQGDHDAVSAALGSWIAGLARAQPVAVETDWWKLRIAADVRVTAPIRALGDYSFAPERAALITAPTLLLIGGRTSGALRSSADRIAAAMPNAQVVLLPGQAHDAITTAPAMIAEAILTFSRSISTHSTATRDNNADAVKWMEEVPVDFIAEGELLS